MSSLTRAPRKAFRRDGQLSCGPPPCLVAALVQSPDPGTFDLSGGETHISSRGMMLSPTGYTQHQRQMPSNTPPAPTAQQGEEPLSHLPPSFSPPLPTKRRRLEARNQFSLSQEVMMYLESVATTHGPNPPSHRISSNASTSNSNLVTGDEVGLITAVEAALRVLCACWTYRGSPHDAFEPTRHLPPVALHLLLAYGSHTVTPDGQYVVLRGGEEQLPLVGSLIGALCSYLHHRSHPLSAPGVPNEATEWECSRRVSRVLLLNCHHFGWLDRLGSDEYEENHRRLRQTRHAIQLILEHPNYVNVGQPCSCVVCAACAMGGDAHTTVLLSDAIVMDGGVPSLRLAPPSATFLVHQEYGRGMACCVPEGRKRDCGEAAAANQVCAAHRVEYHHHSRTGSGSPSASSPHSYRNGSHGVPSPSSSSVSVQEALPSLYDGPPAWMPLSPFGAAHLTAVGCGVYRLPGIVAQGVLLGPTGPVVLQMQLHDSSANGGRGGEDEVENIAPTYASQNGGLDTCVAVGRCRRRSLPQLLYTLVSGEQHRQLTTNNSTATTACGAKATSESAKTMPVMWDGTEKHISETWTASTTLLALMEWVIALLKAPQPTLVVEWHTGRSGEAQNAAPAEQHTMPLGMSQQRLPSTLLELLDAYCDGLRAGLARRGVDGREASRYADPTVLLLEEMMHLRESLQLCDVAAHFDGRERPLVLSKGLEVVAEMEHYLDQESVITSLQYRSVASTLP